MGNHVWAQLALLAAAFLYAFGAIYARRLRGHKPVVIAGGQLMMSAVLLLPFALLIDRPWTLRAVSGAAIWAMVALAVFSTALAYLIYFRILNRAGATNALLVTFLIPVSAILLGLFLLDETPGPAPVRRHGRHRHRPRRHRRPAGAISCHKSSAARLREKLLGAAR